MEAIERFTLDCGTTLLVERNTSMRSAGFCWMLPCGSAADPDDRIGASTVLSDWIWRGAGELNTRELSDAFDRPGVSSDSSVETHHLRVSATMIGERVSDALPLLVSLIRSPKLGDDTFEPVRDLCLQSIESLKDDPQTRSMILLKERHFPPPFNRPMLGTVEGINALPPDEGRAQWRACAVPMNSIIGLAGDVDPSAARDQLNELLSGWTGESSEPTEQSPAPREYAHENDASAQCHIGIAYDAPPEPDDRSMLQRISTAALSGGMSGRLFTEVREKRSLCYSVYASYSGGRDRGAVLGYSGTTPERAQETLDVMIEEFRKMRAGIDQSEFDRAVIGLKSRLVMHGESTSARATSIARDQYLVGRPRSLTELADEVDAITLDQVNEYLAANPVDSFTVVTLGPNALNPPASISA